MKSDTIVFWGIVGGVLLLVVWWSGDPWPTVRIVLIAGAVGIGSITLKAACMYYADERLAGATRVEAVLRCFAPYLMPLVVIGAIYWVVFDRTWPLGVFLLICWGVHGVIKTVTAVQREWPG